MKYCKNCTLEINETDHFCKACGAKIIKERITLKSLLSNLLIALGWDSNFFITLRYLLYQPQKVLKEYINGTRKKYTNPFSFFAIMTAISLFTFSQFSEQFILMSTNSSIQQTEVIVNKLPDHVDKTSIYEKYGYKNETEFRQGLIKSQLEYYNLFAFLFLPIYTLISFFVFRKPYNFGEHLLINTYLQSITTFLSLLLFLFSLLLGINMFGTGIIILPLLFYSFTYKKLYNFTFGRLLLKILKFIGIFLLFMIIPVMIGFLMAAMKE